MDAYQVVTYHDSPTDAAADETVQEVILDEDLALARARALLTDYWQTAAVYAGHMQRDDLGRDVFVDDEEVRWYVGPDYCDLYRTS